MSHQIEPPYLYLGDTIYEPKRGQKGKGQSSQSTIRFKKLRTFSNAAKERGTDQRSEIRG